MSGSNLPMPTGGHTGLANQALPAVANYRTNRAVQRHLQQAVLQYQVEMIDLAASTGIAMSQLQAELAVHLAGMDWAAGDPGLQYLVARKVASFAESNNARLIARYR